MGKQDDVLRKFQILQELDVELGVSDRSDRKNVTNKTGQDRDRSAGGSAGALWGLKQTISVECVGENAALQFL